jgi:hypothetical protein
MLLLRDRLSSGGATTQLVNAAAAAGGQKGADAVDANAASTARLPLADLLALLDRRPL